MPMTTPKNVEEPQDPLHFHCPSCRGASTMIVESIEPAIVDQFLDFYVDGYFEKEYLGMRCQDTKKVRVSYHCNNCGAELLSGKGLAKMRTKLYEYLKEHKE